MIADHFNENEAYRIERPGGMRDWLITYTLSGEGYFQIAGVELRSKAGDAAILKSDTPHKYGTRKGHVWNFAWAHFVPQPEEIRWLQLPEIVPGFSLLPIEHPHMQKRIYRAFRRIIPDSRQTSPQANELCVNALHEILLLLAQYTARPLDPRVTQVIHTLTTRLREPVQIEALARTVGLSASRLSHLFKAETGASIIEMLTQIRLRQAALLLEHTKRSAAEIAWETGFPNYNHFANQFKAFFGISPLQHRKNHPVQSAAEASVRSPDNPGRVQ